MFIKKIELLRVAFKELGRENVVTPEENCAVFKLSVPHDATVVCPSIEDIHYCAERNSDTQAQWGLFYASALSFREQHDIVHGIARRQIDWYLDPKETGWVESKPQAGFYLLSMARVGEGVIADGRVFSQAAMTYKRLTAGDLFSHNRWHRSEMLDAKGENIAVKLDPNGLALYSWKGFDYSGGDYYFSPGDELTIIGHKARTSDHTTRLQKC